MKTPLLKNSLLFLLALIFSVALMFAFTELPRLLDRLLQNNIGFPGFDQGLGIENAQMSEMYISALHLRLIGYLSLSLVAGLIVLGFLTRKTGYAWAGALIVFLPVFGQFALSMFFLAGLGILRTGWLPFLEISDQVLNLGQVAFLPFRVLMWFFGLFGWYAKDFLAWFFMGSGAFLFTWGVLVWLQARFGTEGVATSRIYRISRHPQYLGWIIWSYGVVIFSSDINQMKKSWGFSGSLSWLLMAMIIVGICMLEEIRMKKTYGKAYEDYRDITPFLFPLPSWLVSAVKAPYRWITRRPDPEKKRDVAWFITIYTILFMCLSMFWVDFGDKDITDRYNVLEPADAVDSILLKIGETAQRREVAGYFDELVSLGEVSADALIGMLQDQRPFNREFAAAGLGELVSVAAVPALTGALNDPEGRVRNEAVRSLGKIGSENSVDALLECLIRDSLQIAEWNVFSALGYIGSERSWDALAEGINNPAWYARNSALDAMFRINPARSAGHVHAALYDEHPSVRRKAVYLLMEAGSAESIPLLEQVLEDKDFETRFFAKQAIKKISAAQ